MLRSEHILKGLGNQYYRATYKSMGFTTEDLKRPLIGIANAWSECVPGHYNLRQVAQRSSAPDGALQPAMPPRLPLPVTMICMVRPCATGLPLEA